MQHIQLLIATGIYPPSVGGPATYSKLLFDELPKRGIGVDVVSFDAVRRYPKIIRHGVYVFALLRHARGVTHIYAQDPVSVGLPAWFVSVLLKKKFFVRIAGDYAWEQGVQRYAVSDDIDTFQEKKYGWRVECLRKVQTFVATHAQRVIVPSDYFKELVGGWSKNVSIQRIYNGIELPKLLYDKKQARDTLDIDTHGCVLVSAGRLVPWKGFEELIVTVRNILDTNPSMSIRLYILGDGPDMGILKKKIMEHSLEEHVVCTGSVSREEMFKYLTSADIFVLNTSFESFSFQVVEAMHAGLAVITNAVGSLPELISQGREGLLINKQDADGLQKSIEMLIDGEKKATEMGRMGQEKAQMFSIDKTLDALIKEIRRI